MNEILYPYVQDIESNLESRIADIKFFISKCSIHGTIKAYNPYNQKELDDKRNLLESLEKSLEEVRGWYL